jgi:hypothetical protein
LARHIAATAGGASRGTENCWPTPNVPNGGRVSSAEDVAAKGSTDRGKRQIDLASVIRQWPTPQQADGERGSQTLMRGEGNPTMRGAVLLWATPSAMVANDGEGTETWRARQQILKEKGINGNGAGVPLAIQAQEKAAAWATPSARDWRAGDASDATMERNARPLNEQATHWDGPDSRPAPTTETDGGPSSNATPTSRLQLNAKFVELLMGLPCGWTACEPLATPSYPSKPKPLSESSGSGHSRSGHDN